MNDDPIDQLREDWRRELPDLDTTAMVTVAHLNRLAGMLTRRIDEALGEHGSSLAEFDVLSALRRQGPPFEMMPSQLSRSVMLSPSGMTHRVDQLEAIGLVQRRVDPSNRRSMPVALSRQGVVTAESLVRVVINVEARLLKPIERTKLASLDGTVRALLQQLAVTPR